MTEPSCRNCKHWHGGLVCDAYPKGIPLPIMAGDVSHMKPLPGDNGLQWERKDEAQTQRADNKKP